ncbi:MAG: hypothetical protein IJZ72_06245 [Oscillospiraceae bacterium]|nr:hypothetical protein [Oscillospiraceae bacterium]
MKRIIAAAMLMLAAVSVCTACSSESRTVPLSEVIITETVVPEESIIPENITAVYKNSESAYDPEPFSSYTFECTDGADRYMVTISTDGTGSAFDIILENSSFEFSEFRITPPDKYILNIPYSQDAASNVCTVIRNTVTDEAVPDILEFVFYLDDFEDESLAYTVKKFYSIKDAKLEEITIFDETGGSSEKLEYCSDFTLYHTEPLVFMPSPEVSISKDGTVDADIYTYTFEPEAMTLTKRLTDSSYESSPLYYSYKAYAVANHIAKYFTTTSLNVSDYEHYVEVPSVSSDSSDYFFKVDDERFGTLEELRNFTRMFFTEKLVSDMFINAPQKYRDIDGSLYTIVGDGGYDFTLGKITVNQIDVSGNTVIVYTKQEKFSPDGKFESYIDGGNFVFERDPEDDSFIIMEYRFSY